MEVAKYSFEEMNDGNPSELNNVEATEEMMITEILGSCCR